MTFLTRIVQQPSSLLRDIANFRVCDAKVYQTYVKRSYARWVSRRPKAIVNEDELFKQEDTTQEESVNIFKAPRKRKLKKVEQSTDNVRESTAGIIRKNYKIMEGTESLINRLMMQVKSRKRREKANMILLEGTNLIRDSIKAGVTPRILIFSKKSSKILDELELAENVKLYQVPYQVIETWSNLSTSPGLIGFFDAPDLSKIEPADDALPVTVICDNMRDPRNLGMIMRTVAAVGCQKLILTKGCVDVWNMNVQRCAAAAQFRIPIQMYPTWDEIASLISRDASVYLADNNKYGLFDKVRPCANGSEVNTSVLKEKHLQEENKNEYRAGEEEEEEEAKEERAILNTHNVKRNHIEENVLPPKHSKQEREAMKKFMSQLSIKSCYTLDYTLNEVVLIVGGETEGFSTDLLKFLEGRNGVRVNIPVSSEIDSLNGAMALGILIYEIKRQYLLKQTL